jgi:BolA protein
MAAVIESKLNAALSPSRLAIVDESQSHVGHAGARPEGESHFRVEVVSAAFAHKSRVERQRMVYAVLAEELSSGLHALALRTLTPDEDAAA